MAKRKTSLFDPKIVREAIKDSFRKLDPRTMVRNPVMFVVYVGSILTTGLFVQALAPARARRRPASSSPSRSGSGSPCCSPTSPRRWPRGGARPRPRPCARRASTTLAKQLEEPRRDAQRTEVASTDLRKGDLVLVEAGDIIPGDGEVVEGVASVNEAAVTGESAPVIRESGGDRSSVTGGTQVLSDWLVVRITANPGETFLDRMISLVEGAKRQKTPNEIALSILLAGLTLVFLMATVTLLPFSIYSVTAAGHGTPVTVTVLTALLVCLIPTTIGGLLSAIGIAGMDRMIQANVIATSGRAVEAAGDVDVLLLDKTGTITLGNRQATEFLPADGDRRGATSPTPRSSPRWPTRPPRGAASWCSPRRSTGSASATSTPSSAQFVPFTAQTRMSGVDLDGRQIRKGAADAVEAWVSAQGGAFPADVRSKVETIAKLAAARRWWWPRARGCSA